MTVMSETSASLPHSTFVSPSRAASSAINWRLNWTTGSPPRGAVVIDIANQTIRPVDLCCQSQNTTVGHIANHAAVTIGSEMASRPVFHEDLGLFFRDLREARGWSQRQAATIAKNRRITGVSYQVLQRLEAGRTKNPEPELLRALSKLYEVPYETLVGRWVERRFGAGGRDLIRQTGDQQSGASPTGGSPDESATTRIRELEDRLREREEATREMHSAVEQLWQLSLDLLAPGEDQTARKRKTSGRRPHRKAG